jgi:DNA polymerase elongation subunit (family B)
MMIGGNLFSPTRLKPPHSWQGSGIYASKYQNEQDGIAGCYLKEQGKIEKTIYSLLKKRIALKQLIKTLKKNSPEYDTCKKQILAVKILINTMYGTMGSPIFKSIYSLQGAADCTAMARRSIKHTRTVFEDENYECLYTDTDSVFVLDTLNNKEKIQQLANYITNIQKESFNIPLETHKLELEKSIKRMWFFKDDAGKYIKKHYIYVDEHDELTAKGLSVIKGNCSKLAQEYWNNVLSNEFVSNTFEWLEPEILLIELKRLAKADPTLLEKRYRVNPPETYKVREGKDEATGLNYQISKKFGVGEHWLVINKHIGPGKGNHYAPITMLKDKYGDAWVDRVCFEEYMSELSPFILPENRNKIHKTDRKRV